MREVVSINHAEVVVTSDLYLYGKLELEQAEKHSGLRVKQGSLRTEGLCGKGSSIPQASDS